MNKIHLNCIVAFAKFCAQLEREGIAFKADWQEQHGSGMVEITGH